MAICPDDNEMACYIAGLLSDNEVTRLERHLLGCDRCQEEVEITKKVVAWIEG